MAAVKKFFRVDETLLTASLFNVFSRSFLSLFVENLYTVFDVAAARLTHLDLLPPGIRHIALFELDECNIKPTSFLSYSTTFTTSRNRHEAVSVEAHLTSLRGVQES